MKRLGPTAAAKRLGYKTPAAYLRRLAVAEANKAKADAEAAEKEAFFKQEPESGDLEF